MEIKNDLYVGSEPLEGKRTILDYYCRFVVVMDYMTLRNKPS